MGEFKGIATELDSLPDWKQEVSAGLAIPIEESVDLDARGGLLRLRDSGVIEVTPPNWRDVPVVERVSQLALRHSLEAGFEFSPSDEWDPKLATLGSETELAVFGEKDGLWHNILSDGLSLKLPGGRQVPASEYGFDPEALQCMIEYKTPKAYGFYSHSKNLIEQAFRVESFLENNNLASPPLSVYPEQFELEEVSLHPYVSDIARNKMPDMLEFGCMSEQIHVQMKNPDAGLYALNTYQAYQSIFGLLSAGAPFRDGSLQTTLAEHFGHNPNPAYKNPMPQDDYFLNSAPNEVPFDWREFSRLLGSPSSGTFANPVQNFEQFMQRGSTMLGSGEIPTVSRTLGWHTDRLRLDKGTLEICNLGRSGGNLYKNIAVQEVVTKFILALQETHESPIQPVLGSAESVPPTDLALTGHNNNMFMAMYGKSAKFITPNGQLVEYSEALGSVFAFCDSAGLGVSEQAQIELLNTLTVRSEIEVELDQLKTPDEVLDYFYSQASRLTATEAIRLAALRDTSLSYREQLVKLALRRRKHVYDVYDNFREAL